MQLGGASSTHTLIVQKYENNGPISLFSKMVYDTVPKVWNFFSMEGILDVTRTNSYVNRHF